MKTVASVLLACLALALAVPAGAVIPENVLEVGNARLKVLAWTIYDSTLFSRDGEFRGIEPGLILDINYRRNISRQALLKRTRLEWQRQGIARKQHTQWLAELEALLPGITKGDRITLVVGESLSSTFYFNGQQIGAMQDPDFTRDFLAIWLSENTSYPRVRDKLVGLGDEERVQRR